MRTAVTSVALHPNLKVATRTLVLLQCASLTACVHTFGTPSLKHGVAFREQPDVAVLVAHANCEIATAMFDSSARDKATLTALDTERQRLWTHLAEQNFVATVDFTLTATN